MRRRPPAVPPLANWQRPPFARSVTPKSLLRGPPCALRLHGGPRTSCGDRRSYHRPAPRPWFPHLCTRDKLRCAEALPASLSLSPLAASIQLVPFHPDASYSDLDRDPADFATRRVRPGAGAMTGNWRRFCPVLTVAFDSLRRSPYPMIHLLRESDVTCVGGASGSLVSILVADLLKC